jgi:hypothetical protein
MLPALRIEVEGLVSSFETEQAGMRELLQGPIMGDLIQRAIRVQNYAKQIATGPSPSPPGHGPGNRTGRLRASITYRPGYDSTSPFVDVGTNVFYAPFVEFGHSNKPHSYPYISPGGTFQGMRFVRRAWTAARPFLRPALEAARTT